MPKNYTQCPFCSFLVEEGDGFNAKVWMRAHLKSCVGVDTKSEPAPKTPKRPKAPSSSPTQEVVGRVGEALAKEFVKQLFKKGR